MKKNDNRKPSKLPIVLSAIFPGAGQLMQGRLVFATIFSLGFLCTFAFFMIATFRVISAFYKLGTQFDTAEDVDVRISSILIPLLVALVIWFLNLIDTVRAYWHLCRIQSRRQLHQSQNGVDWDE